ncbi:flagellar assembly protein FliH [Neobacillus sp. SM06]|uniref:flagellar assembly protein FliH n=1 Tax=Neobacillus sp. SM06 TaxID=3422492 RepID=UPI003D2977CD
MSRLIKSQWMVAETKGKKVISIKSFQSQFEENPSEVLRQMDAQHDAILEKAKQEAALIVAEATEKAQAIREQIALDQQAWEEEKQLLVEMAREKGYQEGIALGKEQGCQEWQQIIIEAKEVVKQAKQEYQSKIALAEKTILHLGMKTAERIIGTKLEETEETFLAIVKRTLNEAKEYREIQLHVCPSHYGFLVAQKEELMTVFPKETDLYIYPDEKLSAGSCIIESVNGRIDAAIDSQLDEIKTKLLDLLDGETG